jgi:hypothetical protein
MIDTMTSQNIELSFWDILYMHWRMYKGNDEALVSSEFQIAIE